MSGGGKSIFARGEEFLAVFKRGADFTKELLQENERLRAQLLQEQSVQESAAQSPEEWSKLRQQLLERIDSLEQECTTVRQRLDLVEAENGQFAQRHVEIEEENNALANLYVASYQLHSTLDLDEVLKIVLEIVINLVGAEVFAVYLLDEKTRALQAVAAEGGETTSFPGGEFGSGPIGEAVAANRIVCGDGSRSANPDAPLVTVPLWVQGRPLGALVVYSLLQQKDGFTALDHELFNVLGGHAATAIFAARLYSQSERRLNTIQEFIDLLTK